MIHPIHRHGQSPAPHREQPIPDRIEKPQTRTPEPQDRYTPGNRRADVDHDDDRH
ncbi:MAG TPA: hypothetical protein VFA68_21840 [Terriglobales bacterium]|nr:hypothetical protein [Terriglobales bacterium]